jgi:DNA-binding NarL/FixJ family response regulator
VNNIQRQRIEYLRCKGESFSAIGGDLGISENTVKSYCRRNNIVPKAAPSKKQLAVTLCSLRKVSATHAVCEKEALLLNVY